MLSVVVVSNRVGGLDALFSGLEAQTYRNFELVVIDELHERAGIALRGFRGRRIALSSFQVHAPLRAARWGNYCASLNAGLASSQGERVVFWSDYTCPHPETLATHARFHAEHPNDIMLGGIEYTETPKLHPSFPLRYGWAAIGHDVANHRDETYAPWLDFKRRHDLYEAWRAAYEEDLANGTLDPFMWSTFERPVTSWDDVKDLRVFNHDRRDTSPFLNLKNDSIPLSLLEKIGGFDERADGSHGHQDSITWRALERVGAVKRSVPENPVRVLDAHNIALIRAFRDGKNDESNLGLYEGRA